RGARRPGGPSRGCAPSPSRAVPCGPRSTPLAMPPCACGSPCRQLQIRRASRARIDRPACTKSGLRGALAGAPSTKAVARRLLLGPGRTSTPEETPMAKAAKRTVKHETISIERHLKARPERVFDAWTDPEARRAWVVPAEGWAHDEENMDFRIGGHEVMRFGP